jgi:hypothetical protein
MALCQLPTPTGASFMEHEGLTGIAADDIGPGLVHKRAQMIHSFAYFTNKLEFPGFGF